MRNVARSLATAMSAIIATSRPPAWQIPLTAAMTGAWLFRMARNGSTSWPPTSGNDSSGSCRPPRSPPGAKTSPTPVMTRARSPGSVLTSITARLSPKYMAGVKAFLTLGRSMTHQAIGPCRSSRRFGVPRSSLMCGPGSGPDVPDSSLAGAARRAPD